MSKPVVTARPTETIRAVAKRMNLHGIGCVVVVDQRRVVGVVTERDLLRLTAKGVSPDAAKAREAMSRPPITATLFDEIPEAIRLLVFNNIKKLPVLDDGRLVGIVTFSDFAQLAPAYGDFFASAMGEANRRERERFEKHLHGPPDPWSFV
ncbi:MAG TPA: CBS domain-containing protein [Candidatus Thermoplasmatota archaeon]|nr:CBS domain-containing protein [Candidatus Thermoplasmatota archaeon]